MDRKKTATPRRPKTGWATTALFATVALAMAAGCGSRLDSSEIAAGNAAGAGAQTTGSGGGSGATSDGSTTGSVGAGTTAGDASTTGGAATTSGGAATSSTGGGAATTSTTGAGGPAATTGGGGPAATTGGGGPAATTGGGGPAATTGGGTTATGTPAILGGDPSACKPATGSTVQLGNVSTLSGVLGELFKPVVPALNLFVKSQNACGGLNGHVIKLQLDDDQGDPSTAVTAINRQISNTKVLAFVGNIQVLTVDAIVPIINSKKIPVIGPDLTNDTWYTNPYFFPQGAPSQAVSYGYLDIAKNVAKKPKVGNIYCLEVPVACKNINDAFGDLAGKVGAQNVFQKQVSITAPSYTSQCLEAQQKGVQSLALTFDAASQGRFSNSCLGLRPPYKPQYIAYPLGVGNEQQFFGAGPALGGTYVPLTTFGWMPEWNSTTGKYFQASKSKFGFSGANGNAASLGWTAGALLVAASGKLSANPSTQEILDGLYSIKGNDLGGLSSAKLSFHKVDKGGPAGAVQYCYFLIRSNAANNGWEVLSTKPKCAPFRGARDPNQ